MKTSVIITGLIVIGALTAYALYLGFDGILLTAIVAVIAAAIGVTIPTPKILKGGD